MKEIKRNDLVEYLCPTFILSYLIMHNIYLVLFGIVLSLYLINVNTINSIINYININLFTKNKYRDLNKQSTETRVISNNINTIKEDSNLTLVETIETLGFIPSIDKNDESTKN